MTALLVDGNNIAARAYFAMRELRSSSGEPTGAIMGFLKSLSWVRAQVGITLSNVIVFWDGGRAEFRKRLLPSYKEGRRKDDAIADFYPQVDQVYAILTHAGVQQVLVPKMEADDLIAICCYRLAEKKIRSLVLSSDRDMHQLASVARIFCPKDGLLGPVEIAERWGLKYVRQILLFRAIVGDKSDNIPGVPSVGEVRGLSVIDNFGAERNEKGAWILVRLNKQSEKWSDIVWAHKELVERNLFLMALPYSILSSGYAEDGFTEESIPWDVVPKPDTRAFLKDLERYELDSILSNLSAW